MSLINYIEPVSVGEIFIGMGGLVFLLVFSFVIWKLFKPMIGWITVLYNRGSRYEIIESTMLDKIAKERGIDMQKEMLKRDIFSEKKKSFREKIEEEMFEKMFGKEKSTEKQE